MPPMSSPSITTPGGGACWACNCVGGADSNTAKPIAAALKQSLVFSLIGALLSVIPVMPFDLATGGKVSAEGSEIELFDFATVPIWAMGGKPPFGQTAGSVIGRCGDLPVRTGSRNAPQSFWGAPKARTRNP
jgi:hypothetical protein